MEIVPVEIVSDEIIKAAKEGRIYPHVVCGVDVYRSSKIAIEDGVGINKSIRIGNMFFSGRHYKVIDLLDLDDYDPQSTVADLRVRMMQLKARGVGFLSNNFLEQEDGETAYVLTQLHDSELEELMNLN